MEYPLQILGLEPGCSLDDVRTRFRDIVRKYHPDKNPNNKISEKIFRDTVDAYTAICNNPNILRIPDFTPRSPNQYIRTKLSIDLEDLYLGREHNITYQRKIFCKDCGGTGSRLGMRGLCEHCSGTGKIQSSIASLLYKDGSCPVCKGAGVPVENRCNRCACGYITDSVEKVITFTLNNYADKSVQLKGMGDQLKNGTFGDVIIILDVIRDPTIRIEDNYFRINEKVLMSQVIIGDTAETSIFGRKLKFKIEPGSSDALIRDTIRPGITQLVRVVYTLVKCPLTEQTKDMYQRIRDIEKSKKDEWYSVPL